MADFLFEGSEPLIEVKANIPDSQIDAVMDSMLTCGRRGVEWYMHRRYNSGAAPYTEDYYILSHYPETMYEALQRNGIEYTVID